MSENPFAVAAKEIAAQKDYYASCTTHVEPREPFFKDAIQADRRKSIAANMTRQDMFDNGFITVADLDDEELRLGKCRNTDGRIPRTTNKTSMVRRDLYDEMIAEHEKRTDEKLRQQLDIAIDTMVDIMTDDTAEPRDRFEASKYLFERVKGKTPEKVSVTVKQEPWQELLGGVAKITRQQSLAQREAIDAEVVATPSDSTGDEERAEGVPGEPEDGDGLRARAADIDPTQTPLADMGYASQGDIADIRIKPPGIAPTWENPVNPSATMGIRETKSEEIRRTAEEALALAERRKEARDRIQRAKKTRIIKRTLGVMGTTKVDLTGVQDRLAQAAEGDV